MKIIKKDKKKRFLSYTREAIRRNSLKGKWVNTKCIVNSNYLAKVN